MAKFYSRTRSNYGSLSGTIIIWPVEIPTTNPSGFDNLRVLPSGYLRCDGTKYNAVDYPNLAVVCGTGNNCKFLRRDENNQPLTVLTDEEFVVPDLGSKYPRPVPGASAGEYNNILTQAKSGLYTKRSGIGLEASSNVGDIATVTYSGKFNVPSQEIEIKGKPGWTWGTASNTDAESVDATAIHPHMHFSTTTRVRVKPAKAPISGQDLAGSTNSFDTASTINIDDWLGATTYNEGGLTNTAPGSNQPACWAIASGTKSGQQDGQFFLLIGVRISAYTNFCRSGCELSSLRCYCLLKNDTSYALQNDWFGNDGTRIAYYSRVFLPPVCGPEFADVIDLDRNWNTTGTAPATYTPGASGVPYDSNNISLADVLPINSNLYSSRLSYPQAHNIVSETSENLTENQSDPTAHSHKILFEKTDHTYKIKTDAFLLEPDGLTTTVNLFPTNVASLDAVTSPYIILEYLIQI
jgi:hypothetical protein